MEEVDLLYFEPLVFNAHAKVTQNVSRCTRIGIENRCNHDLPILHQQATRIQNAKLLKSLTAFSFLRAPPIHCSIVDEVQQNEPSKESQDCNLQMLHTRTKFWNEGKKNTQWHQSLAGAYTLLLQRVQLRRNCSRELLHAEQIVVKQGSAAFKTEEEISTLEIKISDDEWENGWNLNETW